MGHGRYEELLSLNPHYIHLENEFVPWTPLEKTLSECKVALVTMGGLYIPPQEPFTDLDNTGDHSFRELPRDLRNGGFQISHTHYNHEWVLEDLNCLLPLDHFESLISEGVIGDLATTHYAFMGSIPNPLGLVVDTGPEVARRMRDDGVNVSVLTSS